MLNQVLFGAAASDAQRAEARRLIVAALLGQGLAPFEAASAGAFLHGRAGELAEREIGGVGMAAGDLLQRIPAARGSLLDGPVGGGG